MDEQLAAYARSAFGLDGAGAVTVAAGARGALGQIWRFEVGTARYALKEIFADDGPVHPALVEAELGFSRLAVASGVRLPASHPDRDGRYLVPLPSGAGWLRLYDWVDLRPVTMPAAAGDSSACCWPACTGALRRSSTSRAVGGPTRGTTAPRRRRAGRRWWRRQRDVGRLVGAAPRPMWWPRCRRCARWSRRPIRRRWWSATATCIRRTCGSTPPAASWWSSTGTTSGRPSPRGNCARVLFDWFRRGRQRRPRRRYAARTRPTCAPVAPAGSGSCRTSGMLGRVPPELPAGPGGRGRRSANRASATATGPNARSKRPSDPPHPATARRGSGHRAAAIGSGAGTGKMRIDAVIRIGHATARIEAYGGWGAAPDPGGDSYPPTLRGVPP